MNLNQGDIVGNRYQIIKELGRGAFGQTYLAEDVQRPGNPKCVVKQLQPIYNNQEFCEQARQRFVREASVLERLGGHPQIPQLLAHFEDNQEFYLVQEFIDGQDFSKELEQTQCLNQNDVIRLLEDVLKVLIYVHEQEVIHRDIKPSNLIRRNQDSKICLIDFGAVQEIVALSVNSQGQTMLTRPIGTPSYMPHEQLKGKPNFTSDIYALGVTAIQALVGTIPGEDPRTGEFVWRTNVQVHPRLNAILSKMVCKRSSERYQSALDAYNDLQNFKAIANRKVIPWLRLFPFVAGGILVVALLGVLIAHIFVEKENQLFNEANELFDSGEYAKAIQLYEQVLQSNPSDYEALINQGDAYSKLQKYPDSLKTCEKAIKINLNEANGWNCKALALQNLAKYPEALTAHDRAIQLDAKSAVFWNNRGETQLKLKQYDKAIADFDAAILLDEKSALYWFNKGKAFSESGKYPDAIASLDRAIALNPNYYYAWTARGNSLRLLGKYEEALSSYDRAIDIAPKDYESWYSKGLTLEKLGKNKQALEYYNQAIQIDQNKSAAIQAKERLEKK